MTQPAPVTFSVSYATFRKTDRPRSWRRDLNAKDQQRSVQLHRRNSWNAVMRRLHIETIRPQQDHRAMLQILLSEARRFCGQLTDKKTGAYGRRLCAVAAEVALLMSPAQRTDCYCPALAAIAESFIFHLTARQVPPTGRALPPQPLHI